MDEGYTFHLSYFSEVSVEITLQEQDGYSRFTATHPVDTVPIDDWFHFSGSYNGRDPLIAQDLHAHEALCKLGNALYPGARGLLEDTYEVENPQEQFFTDLYLAFVYGSWMPASKKYPDEWEHDVGEQLSRKL